MACTEAHLRAAKKYRTRIAIARGDLFGQRTGTVPVTCWCEADVVRVPLDAVGASTDSCGRPGCREPQAA